MVMTEAYFVGVDVGTSSVRAALVDKCGAIKSTMEEPVSINNPQLNYYEQSSDEIWEKCCKLVKMVSENVSKDEIKGIGFDATCSLVVLDEEFKPVAVNKNCSSEKCYDIIMWMDHRAEQEADFINSQSHSVLKYVGGKISLEMEPPKLLWLKKNLPRSWEKAAHFFDLADFLTFKTTGSLSRSLCSVTCKWLYCDNAWSSDFWKSIGLEELTHYNFSKIGSEVLVPGSPIENGLTTETAMNMNLNPSTPVAAALLDAHCGGIGTIYGDVSGMDLPCEGKPLTERISFICGTSSCHMALSEKPLFVPGVWGPYYSAMVPGYWLNEGGQSATGSLIDHVVRSHPAYRQLKKEAESKKMNLYKFLNEFLTSTTIAAGLKHIDYLGTDIHVSPDFHGNRSPLADPTLRGAVCGLALDQSLEDLAKQYLATIQALALGSLHIIETLEKSGHHISTIFMCGGLSKNKLFVQIHANALNRPVVLSKETEAVLLGGAILGACASKEFANLQDAMKTMSKSSKVVRPNSETISFYDKKKRVFHAMTKHQLEYKTIMHG